MISIGDIIIIPTAPPHLASVVDDKVAMCEDGVVRPYPPTSTVAYTALELLKTLEEEVLRQNDAG